MSLHEQLWNTACQQYLSKSIDDNSYERWIQPIKALSLVGDTMELGVKDEWGSIFIPTNYGKDIKTALQMAVADVSPESGLDIVVKYSISGDGQEVLAADSEVSSALVASQSTGGEAEKVRVSKPSILAGIPLDPNFTFENFVEGPSNSFASAAAAQVAVNPGSAYNPLLIYGDTGLGKTHLMQAIAHRILESKPKLRIVYVTLEKMLNDFIESIRENTTSQFRKRYRNTDVLLVDDVQFLAKSQTLQEEFFNTFNALQNEHKQIILTSDLPPNQIKGLEVRLVSRFQQGLITDIQTPDYATRLAILRSKQRNEKEPLPDEFLSYIAQNITSNIRLLEGALTKLICYRSLIHEPLTIELVTELLRTSIAENNRADPTCPDIQRTVAEEFGLKIADITGKDRPQNVAFPRQIAMFLCRSLTHCSLPEIGRQFGKTHATIVHACKSVHDRMETDISVRRRIGNIVAKLGRSIDDLHFSTTAK